MLVSRSSAGRPSPESFRSRFPPLLQSVPSNHSPPSVTRPKKASFRAVLRLRLGGSGAEQLAESLSKWPVLSKAWGLADLLYKLFQLHYQSPI
jgi:hypothetical protein